MKKLSDTYNAISPVKFGEIVEGTVLGNEKSCVFVDLGARGTGILRGREFYNTKETVRDLENGKKIVAKVTSIDTEDGYVDLSFTAAQREVVWGELSKRKEANESMMVKVLSANRGGLIARVEGVDAFLPVSQLSSEHYPKVEDGDPTKILDELQKFVGQELSVNIFSLDPKSNQVIISERLKELESKKETLKQFAEGDVISGEITAICDFGAFIRFGPKGEKLTDENSLEGLIHISELDWQLIESPADIVEVGETIEAKILQIKDDKVFLSLKQLKDNPWDGIETKVAQGDTVKGVVKKLNPYGAFVEVLPKIQGLCHVSEFETPEAMREQLAVGETHEFIVAALDPADYKITLEWPKK